jgi:hypothetical protein
MTLDLDSSGVPASGQPEQERPTDPRPAWERIAYAWPTARSTPANPSTRPPWPAKSAWHPASPATWCGSCAPNATATLACWSCGAG